MAVALTAFLASAGCRDAEPTRIVVLGTTDVHGYLVPYDYATDEPTDNSLAQVATIIDSVRRAEPHVVLVDSGDLLQGASLNEYQARVERDAVHPVVAAMNTLAYDGAAIGNHEFNYGIGYMESALAGAEFPFLAANITAAGSDSLVHPPFTIVERAGVRIGIISFTTPGVLIWDRANVEGRLDFQDIVEAGARWIPRLLEAGADLVVVAAHAGLGPGSTYGDATGVPEENPLARLAIEVPGIDVIFAGHTAEAIPGRRIGGALVLHAGRHADHLAVAELSVRRTPAGIEVESVGRVVPTRGVAPRDDLVTLVRSAHERTVAWLGQPIGYTPDRWTSRTARREDTPISDLVTHVQADVAGSDLSAAAVFRTDVAFGPGPITRRDILGLYTFPNTLRAVRLSGSDLKAFLERSARYYRVFAPETDGALINDSVPGYNFDIVSGVEYGLDLRRPVGDRVVDLRFRGASVGPTDSFTMALNNYRQSGGGGFGMIADAPVVYTDETDIATRIIEFIMRRDTLRTTDVFVDNWELRPEAAVVRLEGSR
ncbi:MAG: 5'-nucleotidase C-terminal domain-containing protein [Gemmatimonadetes bacterium]|nr:5'-nucleotidase C-terminal domain-containing protein [Gemmatimonadota bacterium]